MLEVQTVPFLDHLYVAFNAAHTPDRHIALDESVILLKGQVSFCHYLKGKPHPWGIKAYVLSEIKSGYLQGVCYGRETQLIGREDLSQTPRVVLMLVEGLHSKRCDLCGQVLYLQGWHHRHRYNADQPQGCSHSS